MKNKSLINKLKQDSRFKVWEIGEDRWLVEDYDQCIMFVLMYQPFDNEDEDDWHIYAGHIDKFCIAPIKESDIIDDGYSESIKSIFNDI